MKMSIELPVANRHRHDMTEKLLKATLNPNKQQQDQLEHPCSLITLHHLSDKVGSLAQRRLSRLHRCAG